MPDLEVLTPADRDRWLAVLSRVGRFDSYHLPQYHDLAERTGDGQARLLVYDHAEGTVVLPLLLRSCGSIEGLEGESSLDIGSVYGYAGPLSSRPIPAAVIAGFQSELRTFFGALGVAAVYSSLHPLIPQADLIAGLGETRASGTTVSIDLTLSPEAQRAQYRANHVRDIRKLRALGVACQIDDPQDPGQFIEIYHQTMARVGAASHYFFNLEYFSLLKSLLGSRVKLLTCTLDGVVIAAGLFLVSGDIVQYHLGGARDEYVGLGPMKLVIDAAREWGSNAGLCVLHLGGGVGAQEDSLFHFKAGFSDRRHPFATWRWAPDPGLYDHLAERKAKWNATNGLGYVSPEHFPIYRGQVAPG